MASSLLSSQGCPSDMKRRFLGVFATWTSSRVLSAHPS